MTSLLWFCVLVMLIALAMGVPVLIRRGTVGINGSPTPKAWEKRTMEETRELVGHVGVDSGTVMIMCPHNLDIMQNALDELDASDADAGPRLDASKARLLKASLQEATKDENRYVQRVATKALRDLEST